MAKRTTLNFTVDRDVWPVVEIWAKDTDHRETDRGASWRRYKSGSRQVNVEIRQDANNVELQAWMGSGWMESDIGPGFVGLVARAQARDNVNILLRRLGQKQI